MNLLKLKIIGHPIHPVMTDFPIALWITSILGDVVYFVTKDPTWTKFGFWLLVLGTVSAVPAAITGLIEYLNIPDESPAARKAAWHMFTVIIAGSFFFLSLILRVGGEVSPETGKYVATALSVCGAITLLIAGWFGGELVFRFRVGCKEEY